ncbi:hypothetical protein AF332_11825 [Sporosarcina globispora]|uniref:Uncharacterized protein n=1 Tax=Sporosarcina globispora TaxID=1459 RepID=A0A0M0GD62_SPOGL|nr:hypothetical protein [Sporosarcina globispora]KON87447.1 hypothetical protein AF332_11825 [Sporosarcina globispora]
MYYVTYKNYEDMYVFELPKYTEEIGKLLKRFVGSYYEIEMVFKGEKIFSKEYRIENTDEFLKDRKWEVEQGWYDELDEDGSGLRDFIKLKELIK